MAEEKENNSVIIRSFNRLSNLILGQKSLIHDSSILLEEKNDKIKSLFTLSDLKSLYNKLEEKSYNSNITGFLKETSNSTIEIIKKNKNVESLIPEINSAKNIWVTSIMSPTDLQTNSLSFNLDLEDLDKDAKTEIEGVYEDLFLNHLDLETTLMKAIEECLFGAGSYPLLVIPQQNLNMVKFATDLRNIGKESIGNPYSSEEVFNSHYERFVYNNKGITEKPILVQIREFNRDNTIAMESLNDLSLNTSYHLETNVALESIIPQHILKDAVVNKVQKSVTGWFSREDVREKLIVSMNPAVIGDRKKLAEKYLTNVAGALGTDKEKIIDMYENMFYSELGNFGINTPASTAVMDSQILKKGAIPIGTHVPSECVVPIGIGEEHIAYFVLVDAWGTPISKVLMTGYETQFSNSLIDMSVNAVYGPNGPVGDNNSTISLNNHQKYTAALSVFDITLSKILENKLSEFGLSGMSIGMNQTIGRCIFHHLLQQSEIGLILVPKQLMTYYAVDYRPDGTGKSMLEDMEYVLSMRSTLLVSKILAMVRSAVEKTTIEIDMSKNSNPLQTMRILQNAFFSKNKLELSNDLNTIVKNIYDSRVSLIPKNLKGAEDYSIQTSTEAPTTVRPDEDLLEYFDKLVISGFLVPTSAIQETENTDYATSIVSKNLFFANVVRIKRDIFLAHTTKFVKTFTLYFPYVRLKIEEILRKYYYVSEEVNESELDKDVSENVPEKDEELYIKETDTDLNFDKKEGDVVGSDRHKITDKELHKLCEVIMSSIVPTLPCPTLLKGKTQFEEINSYMETLNTYIESIYPDSYTNGLPEEAKNYYIALKSKIKSDLLLIYKDKVGKQDIFNLPEMENMDIKYFTELNQILLNGSKLISDEIKVLNPVAEDEGSSNAW